MPSPAWPLWTPSSTASSLMSETTSSADALAKVVLPERKNSGKDAWVTPVVREYDPGDVTTAITMIPNFPDGGIYS